MSAVVPCPFCGNPGTCDPRHTIVRTVGTVAVRCGQCGAQGPFQRTSTLGDVLAVESWNTRATPKDSQ